MATSIKFALASRLAGLLVIRRSTDLAHVRVYLETPAPHPARGGTP